MLRYLALLSLTGFGGLIVWLLLSVPITPQKSVSIHIAKTAQTTRMAKWMLIGIHVALLFWVWGWAYWALSTGIVFSLVMTFVCVFGVIVGIVPYSGTIEQKRMHDMFAWLYSIPLLMTTLMLVSRVSMSWQMIVLAVMALVQAAMFYLFLSYRPSRRYFLWMQISYLTLANLAFVIASY